MSRTPPPLPQEYFNEVPAPKPIRLPLWGWLLCGGVALFVVLGGGFAISTIAKDPGIIHGRDKGCLVATTIEDWLESGGDLGEKIAALGDDAVADDSRDIHAMKNALIKLTSAKQVDGEEISQVVELIQGSENTWVMVTFDDEVFPVIKRWARRVGKSDASEEEQAGIFGGLRAAAWNFSPGAGGLIVELVNAGFAPDSEEWSGVFGLMEPDESTFKKMIRRFRKSPPRNGIGRALLSRANRLRLDGAWNGDHPYDSLEGAKILRSWLEADTEGSFDAAVSLAFVSSEIRKALLPLALSHPDSSVQLEGAWAELESGGDSPDPAALKRLITGAENLEESTVATRYLEETGYEESVPDIANDPGWRAKAQMVEWLMHPAELGKAPLSITEYDYQELIWPPNLEDGVPAASEPIYLFAFTYLDEGEETPSESFGIVHSTFTWSNFDKYDARPTAKELYGKLCALELTWEEEEEDAPEVTPSEALEMIKKANPDF